MGGLLAALVLSGCTGQLEGEPPRQAIATLEAFATALEESDRGRALMLLHEDVGLSTRGVIETADADELRELARIVRAAAYEGATQRGYQFSVVSEYSDERQYVYVVVQDGVGQVDF